MRSFMLTLAAASLALPVTIATAPLAPDAAAKTYKSGKYKHREKRCRYSSGTTGLVAGGVGGAVVGNKVLGGGLLGTAAGAVGGALGGRAIDRSITAKKRCR